jgi:phosphatidylinositol glycan class B
LTLPAWTRDRGLWAIVAAAAVLRIAVAAWPVIHHSDELWQYLEPARHVAGEPWIQTWEARAGARGWLLPMLLAGPLAIGNGLAPGTMLGIFLARLPFVLLSLGAVVGAAGLGFRLSRAHGLMAGFVAAIWYELVYFGPRTLSEAIATSLFVIAAWLLLGEPRPRRMLVGGALLGLCCVIRFQYAPAALVLVPFVAGLRWRDWALLAAGGMAALLVSAVADLAMGATPFLWIVRNLQLNLVANRSAAFGVSAAHGYLGLLWQLWGLAAIPIVGLAILGARRYPALMAVAVANFVVHSAIAHKEYRFILLTNALLVVLAAIGSVDVSRVMTAPRRRLALIAGGWFALSVGSGALGSAAEEWGGNSQLIAAWHRIGQAPELCGVGLYRNHDPLIASYALLGRPAPIYQYDAADAPAAQRSRAFNLAIAPAALGDALPGFHLVNCPDAKRRGMCVYARLGTCTVSPADREREVNAILTRLDI